MMDIRYWYQYNDQEVERYLKDFIAKEKRQGNKVSVVHLAPKLGLRINTLYYLMHKYNLKNQG